MSLLDIFGFAVTRGLAEPQSRPVEVGVRCGATDDRVRHMDQSIWPNVGYAFRSASQLFRSVIAANQV